MAFSGTAGRDVRDREFKMVGAAGIEPAAPVLGWGGCLVLFPPACNRTQCDVAIFGGENLSLVASDNRSRFTPRVSIASHSEITPAIRPHAIAQAVPIPRMRSG